jgi:hypothetical protein
MTQEAVILIFIATVISNLAENYALNSLSSVPF